MAQFARPISDVSTGSWTPSTGASLWACIDEQDASEADFIQSSLTANDSCEVRLSPVEAALIDRLHILNYRARKSGAAGNTRGVTVDLLQGATVIASQSHPDLTALWPTPLLVLTKEQGASITDYTDLRVRFMATGATGGNPNQRRAVQMSWCQLRVPDTTDLLDDWRTRWGVPADVDTLEELIDWLRPLMHDQIDAVTRRQNPLWVRRYNLVYAVWKLSTYRPILDAINAGTYILPPHQTQQFAVSKITGKLSRFQSQADTADTEDAP